MLVCISHYRCRSLQLLTGKRSTGTQTRRECNNMAKNNGKKCLTAHTLVPCADANSRHRRGIFLGCHVLVNSRTVVDDLPVYSYRCCCTDL